MSHSAQPPANTFAATIAEIRQETPSIKSFWLDYGEQAFRFEPGQWIDLYVDMDGKTEVGGYSMTSTPLERGRLQLAIKASEHHVVTRHLHERARVGDRVRISGGQGPFRFRSGMARELVLLGAGIGVTALISILRYVRDAESEVGATLLYSVAEPEDILFREELERISAIRENLRCLFTLTGAPPPGWTGLTGRIDRELLDRIDPPRDACFFYCGSRDFVDDLTRHLSEMGVPEDRLVYERWW